MTGANAMGMNNVIFLEVIEWFDESGQQLAHRIPEEGSGEIKYGAQLTVRESQVAVFYYKGKAIDAFGPGRHTLTTANIPLLTKILSIPWGMTSPLRAEVYFMNMKVFPNLKWGTRDPVAFKDSQLGLIRLRAFGVFNIRVVQPVLFVNSLVGTKGVFTTADVEEYLNRVIVSRLNDYMGEHVKTVLDLPGQYDLFSRGLMERLRDDFAHFGLALHNLYITSITPPPEVQQAIDDKSRLKVFDDLDKLARMKAAMALERAAGNESDAGTGMGLGLGMMMPAMFSGLFGPRDGKSEERMGNCPDCGRKVPDDARFCPWCGHQQLVQQQCAGCAKNLPPSARFCPLCGEKADARPQERKCPHCGTMNLPGATFCNQCGERVANGSKDAT
jgi:membrane protease subunit (stomatin/prohibitin family)